MREMSSGTAVPDQGIKGKGEEKKIVLPTMCWWEVNDRDAFSWVFFYILEVKKTPHISYCSKEYLSLMFLSLVQFSVSSDPPDILCAALYLFLCSNAPRCQWEYEYTRYFIYRAISARFGELTWELLQGPKKMVKSRARPTRWHCGWLY